MGPDGAADIDHRGHAEELAAGAAVLVAFLVAGLSFARREKANSTEADEIEALALASAVPAVAAYNYFQRRLKVLGAEMSNFSNDFMNIVKRHFF